MQEGSSSCLSQEAILEPFEGIWFFFILLSFGAELKPGAESVLHPWVVPVSEGAVPAAGLVLADKLLFVLLPGKHPLR